MLKKPRLESVVVLVTSLATFSLTAAALLMPAPDSPVMTAVTSTPAVVPGVPAAAHSATARICAGGEAGKPARHAAPAAVPPAASAPRPLGGSRICTLSLLHRSGKPAPPCRVEPCRGGASDGPAGGSAGGLSHSFR